MLFLVEDKGGHSGGRCRPGIFLCMARASARTFPFLQLAEGVGLELLPQPGEQWGRGMGAASTRREDRGMACWGVAAVRSVVSKWDQIADPPSGKVRFPVVYTKQTEAWS